MYILQLISWLFNAIVNVIVTKLEMETIVLKIYSESKENGTPQAFFLKICIFLCKRRAFLS